MIAAIVYLVVYTNVPGFIVKNSQFDFQTVTKILHHFLPTTKLAAIQASGWGVSSLHLPFYRIVVQ